MKQGLSAKYFNNESAETRGSELEKAYAKFLEGRIVGGKNDRGVDIVFDDERVPLIQVKSSWEIAERFLAESLRRVEFIPIVVGDFGEHKKEEIFDLIVENGGWVGIDIPDREEKMFGIKRVRNMIFSNGGHQKQYFDGEISGEAVEN